MNQVRDFTFYHPYAALFLLFIIPILCMQFYLYRYRLQKIQSFADPTLLKTLLIGRSRLYTLCKTLGWSLLWIFACLALMDPIGNLRYRRLASAQPQEETVSTPRFRPHEVIFLVDTSASMSVPDGPLGQTRLDHAKEIMDDVVRQLKGPTVALEALTSVLTPIVPPTLDYLFVRIMIRSLHYDEGAVGGTLFKPVLTTFVKDNLSAPSDKLYSVVILSDGGDNTMEGLTGEERTKTMNEMANLFPNPEEYHLRVFTVGLGSATPQKIPNTTYEGKEVTSALQADLLQAIANRNRGQYFNGQDEISWNLSQALVEKIEQDPPLEQKGEQTERKVVAANPEDIIYDLYFQIPLGIAIVTLLMILILPDVRKT